MVRKMILSLSIVAIVLGIDVKTTISEGEIKNTTTTNDNMSVTVQYEVIEETPIPKTETLETDSKDTDRNKDTIQYEDYGTFVVTAYTSGYESTQKKKGDPLYGITASGTRAKEGRTIACPKSIPFGVEIYIPELNHTYVCEDRGGFITNGHLDIYMNSLKKAQDFGRQKFNVKIKVDND